MVQEISEYGAKVTTDWQCEFRPNCICRNCDCVLVAAFSRPICTNSLIQLLSIKLAHFGFNLLLLLYTQDLCVSFFQFLFSWGITARPNWIFHSLELLSVVLSLLASPRYSRFFNLHISSFWTAYIKFVWLQISCLFSCLN